jgi:hypothetical protein
MTLNLKMISRGKHIKLKKKLQARENARNFLLSGGDEQDRTAGLLNAIQALSQLSYTPDKT